jgi:hypothetical protein
MWADPPDLYRGAFHEWFNAVVTRSFPDELELGAFSNGCIWRKVVIGNSTSLPGEHIT